MQQISLSHRSLTASLILSVWAVLIALPLLCFAPTYAQTGVSGAAEVIPPVKVQMLANVKAVVAGSPFKLGVELVMPAGWHTYYKTSGDAGLPTTVKWNLPAGFVAGPLQWQKPTVFSEDGITTYGYKDKTLIATTVRPPASAPSGGKLTFSATVKWLQCNHLCVPGLQEAVLSLPTAVAGPVTPDNTAFFATVGYEGVPTVGKTGGIRVHILTDKLSVQGAVVEPSNFGQYFLWAFIGGFLLNFMPCVLPVISLKLLGFVKQAGENSKRTFQLALAFTAGIMMSFALLGGLVIALQQAGYRVGWGFQFQSPVFVIVMTVIVLLLSLSLFGLFYLAPPPGSQSLNPLAAKEGLAGSFANGVLATTLSTPCTAPFLGTAVGFAFTEPPWVIIAVFLTVGAGMASPYLFLTAKPGWMRFIPKPGEWMVKFKEALGFLLLATVVWLLQVLGAEVGYEPVLYLVAFLVVVSFAVWLGSSFSSLSSSAGRRALVWTVALATVAAGYYYLIARVAGLGAPPVKRSVQAALLLQPSSKLQWLPFNVNLLDESLSGGKTVFLDFTAQWCLTCKVNEQAVLSNKTVVERMRALGVVAMKADWTRQDEQISNLLHKFGRWGVPLYVVFPAGSPDKPIVLPEVITVPLVLDALEKARQAHP